MTVEGVVVGWVEGMAYPQFLDSLCKVYERGDLVGHVSGKSRNDVVRQFLERIEPWLLLTEPDAVFGRDLVELLLEATRLRGHKVVGALSFDGDPREGVVPGAWRLEDRGGGQRRLDPMERYGYGIMQTAHAVDAHALLVHREVLEAVRDLYQDHTALTWFAPQSRVLEGRPEEISEQVTFCVRAQEAGYQVALHAGVHADRMVSIKLMETDFQRYLYVREEQEAFERSRHTIDLTPGKFTVRVGGVDIPANPYAMSRAQRRQFIREQGKDAWKTILNNTIQVPAE